MRGLTLVLLIISIVQLFYHTWAYIYKYKIGILSYGGFLLFITIAALIYNEGWGIQFLIISLIPFFTSISILLIKTRSRLWEACLRITEFSIVFIGLGLLAFFLKELPEETTFAVFYYAIGLLLVAILFLAALLPYKDTK